MRLKFYFLLGGLLLISCNNQINQYKKLPNNVQKRDGKWKEVYKSELGDLVEAGRYKEGEKVGVWKTTLGGKMFQKEKIKNNISTVSLYYPNGKVRQKGVTKMDINSDERHWYYSGDWKYYDNDGKLEYIKKYNKGQKIDSIYLK